MVRLRGNIYRDGVGVVGGLNWGNRFWNLFLCVCIMFFKEFQRIERGTCAEQLVLTCAKLSLHHVMSFISAPLSLASEVLEHYGFAHVHGWLAGFRRGCENLCCLFRLFYGKIIHNPFPQENGFILKLKTLFSFSFSLCIWQCGRARNRETHRKRKDTKGALLEFTLPLCFH